MGVYIKGMEMPRSCKECGIRGVYCRTYIGFHHKDTARARKCPLVEIEDEPFDKDINVRSKDEPQNIIGESFPSYITEDRTTQVLDGWQTNPRTSTTVVEDEPQTEVDKIMNEPYHDSETWGD